jgi:hypothetical protein
MDDVAAGFAAVYPLLQQSDIKSGLGCVLHDDDYVSMD